MSKKPNITEKEKQIFQLLHEEHLHDAKTFNKPSYKGIWAGIVDKYKEKAHFVYELLQNADDAGATEAIFSLEEDRLVFRHNGTVGFSISREDDTKHKGHINAITGVGNSTKLDTDGNTIGKFGVGFKAVFQYTATPHIYDDKFWFRIDNYIVPTMLDTDFPGRKDGETVFVFPFTSPKDAYKEITGRLSTLENPIVFLRNLKKVRIDTIERTNITYEKAIIEHNEVGDVSHDLYEIGNYGKTSRIHMFTRPVVIVSDGEEFKQQISVGYLLDENGKLDVSQDRKVYCYFPTAENFKLKCIVHAPFLLVDSRQQLKDNEVNTDLKKQIAKLAADALIILRDYGVRNGSLLIDENIFSIIPESEFCYYPFNKDDVFRNAYIEELKTSSLLLTRGNRYISSSEALICRPISMMNIITDDQLTKLKNFELDDSDEDDFDYLEDERHDWFFLREETQKLYTQGYVENLLDEIEVGVYKGEDLARDIDGSFMETYGVKWAKRLYAHLKNEQVGLWKRGENLKKKITDTPFCTCPIILSDKGGWVAPFQKSGVLNIYLPIEGSSDGYLFIASELYSDKECLSFFKELGLKEPDAWDYIKSVVLKKYSESGKISSDTVNGDFELIFGYVNKVSSRTEKEEIFSFLRENMLLVCLDRKFRKAECLYEDNSHLRRYLNNNSALILNSNYYHTFIDKYSIQEFNSFVRELGVQSMPRVESHLRPFKPGEARSLGIANYTSGRVDDFFVEKFSGWKPSNIEDSKWFWKCYSIISKHTEYHKAKYSYQYYQSYKGETESSFIKDVKEVAWMITTDGKYLKPSEINLEQLQEAEYYIDYDLIHLFGIERKTKSLEELGASDSQIKQNERGKLAEKYGFTTEAVFKEAAEALAEKREREKVSERNRKDSNASTSKEFLHSEDMRKTSLDEMSSSTKEYGQSSSKAQKGVDERVHDITQKLADEAQKRIEEENLRAGVNDLVRYTKKWFTTLLELEYTSSSSDADYGRNQVKIAFDRFRKEPGSTQIYVLSNPSRNIPIWIEEIGGLTVKFTFLNKDDVSFSFDVANVKDFTLRLKAKSGDVVLLDKIDWTKCTKAVVEVNSPSEIMNKLKSAFSQLDCGDEYNFRENLNDNISFVFGPPGTGKTTRLAEIIRSKMERKNCHILVLAPTNKACDVLTRKLMASDKNASGWLGRFVATGDDVIETEGVLIDRDSRLWKNDKCCIVSTIARFPYDGFIESDGKSNPIRDMKWDFIIIDEASMIPLVQIVYTIYKIKDTNYIIAGDPLQIPPIVKEKAWEGENIYSMVKLDNFENPSTSPIQFNVEKLGTQYRSVPAIGSLYSKYSYDGKLNHSRKDADLLKLPLGNLALKPVTFVPFRVERFDSIFGAKKLNGSNVHIYSAVFAVETAAYLAKQQIEDVRIGVICPYAPQAQLINKMVEQRTDIPMNVDIQCGTIHGFQGDQCEIIITVLNPPTGIKADPRRIMLNNKKVINVAISRASDYLIVLAPHPDSYGYENLIEINNLCGIAKGQKHFTSVLNSDEIEKLIFGSRSYIEDNTFVTTHQLANVYTSASSIYEIRIDENAVDIQVSGDSYSIVPRESNTHLVTVEEVNDVRASSDNSNDSKVFSKKRSEISDKTVDIVVDELLLSMNVSGQDAVSMIRALVLKNSSLSHYTAIQFVGNAMFRLQHNLPEVTKDDIKKGIKGIPSNQIPITAWLYQAYDKGTCPVKKHTNVTLSEFSYSEYLLWVGSYSKPKPDPKLSEKTKTKRPRIMIPKGLYTNQKENKEEREEDKIYNKYEYGLSDW